jgi:PAS domain S-box-containing protein
MVSSFNTKTRKTAYEISEILSGSMYNVDNEGVIKNARIYLLSGSLSGIEIHSSTEGLLIREVKNEHSLIEPITVDLSYNNIFLGTSKFWFDDAEIKNTQNMLVMFMILTIIISLIVNGAFIYFAVYFLFKPPLDTIQSKIEEVAGGAYENVLTDTKYEEFNHIIKSVNNMSSVISSNTKKLQLSEKKYTEIFNNIYVAVIIHDIEGKVIDVNETMLKMFGLENKNEALSYSVVKDYSDIKNPLDKINITWEEVMTGQEKDFEWTARKPLTGEIFNTYVSLKKFILDETAYIMANIIDITERKIAEEKLIHAQKMEALGTLSGGLAHDFNNTLVGITAPLSLMEFNFKDTDFPNKNKFNEYLSIMKKSADRAAGIINQLLSIARKQDFNSSKINLNELLVDLIKFSESTIDKSIEIIFKPYSEPALIKGDSNQIEQVILNLIVNASHSMTFMREENEKWGGLLEIKIDKFTPDDFFLKINSNMKKSEYWHIDIKDNGIGISKENIQKIFNPFFTTKTNGKGTGLGLSMVYNIINQHNGHINVYSEPGFGSIFNIYLPVLKDNHSREAVPVYTEGDKVIKRDGMIMVIDDEEDVRDTVRIMLETCGYKTHVSEDIKNGIIFFKNNYKDINAVILDFSMPGNTGREVLTELMKVDPDVKVLLSSGFGLDDRTSPLLDLGVKAFLKKPYTFEQLIESLDKVLSK